MATLDTLAAFDALAARPPQANYARLNLRNGHVVLAFDDSTAESTDFLGIFPANYSGGDLLVVLTWTSATATSGVTRWSAALERHPIGDPTHGTLDLDADDFGTAVEVDSSAPTVSGELVEASLTITALLGDDPQAHEGFRLRVSRSAANAADTMTGAAELLTVEVREA